MVNWYLYYAFASLGERYYSYTNAFGAAGIYIMIMKKSHTARKWLLVSLLAVLLTLSLYLYRVLPAQQNEKRQLQFAADRARLEREFHGAYTQDSVTNDNIVEVTLVASEGEIELFPGIESKVWYFNGTVPGPEIRIQLGDTLRIRFVNNLPQESSIHFHGIRVPNAMDGVPGVTQPAIAPGEHFIYQFTPKDSGTYWFHPHANSSEQIERGLYGLLIVEDSNDAQYSQDRVLVIDDWRILNDHQIDPHFVTPHDLAHDGRWGNIITVNSSLDYRIVVRPGERIRLRMLNSSNGRVYRLGFGELKAKIIAVDGMLVQKVFDAQGFDLAPGNRIDVDVTIPVDLQTNIFAIEDMFTFQRHTLAYIVVKGEAVLTPQFAYPTNPQLPQWDTAAHYPVDIEYRLNIQQFSRIVEGERREGLEWTINDQAFPRYTQYNFEHNRFYKMRFVNASSRIHPMHIHGQFFKVISRNGEPVNEPFFRDTVLIYSQERVEIAMVPLDRGIWAHHCHILEHADSGMMTLFQVL